MLDAPRASTAATPAPVPAASEDLRLVTAVLRKDRKATAEFVDRYSDVLYSYLHSRLFPRIDLVDDVLQEVFLAAWEHLSRFEGRSPLKNWLIGIARHKVEGHYRGRLREPEPLEEEDQEAHPSSVDEFSIDELLDRERLHVKAREVLEQLPENYRIVLLWRYWERRSANEMAAQTGKTPKAIERLLARARKQFERRWSDE